MRNALNILKVSKAKREYHKKGKESKKLILKNAMAILPKYESQ